jgi:hypothetical protein
MRLPNPHICAVRLTNFLITSDIWWYSFGLLIVNIGRILQLTELCKSFAATFNFVGAGRDEGEIHDWGSDYPNVGQSKRWPIRKTTMAVYPYAAYLRPLGAVLFGPDWCLAHNLSVLVHLAGAAAADACLDHIPLCVSQLPQACWVGLTRAHDRCDPSFQYRKYGFICRFKYIWRYR